MHPLCMPVRVKCGEHKVDGGGWSVREPVWVLTKCWFAACVSVDEGEVPGVCRERERMVWW